MAFAEHPTVLHGVVSDAITASTHCTTFKMHQGDTGLRIALEIAQHEHLLQLQTEKAWGLFPDNSSLREIVP